MQWSLAPCQNSRCELAKWVSIRWCQWPDANIRFHLFSVRFFGQCSSTPFSHFPIKLAFAPIHRCLSIFITFVLCLCLLLYRHRRRRQHRCRRRRTDITRIKMYLSRFRQSDSDTAQGDKYELKMKRTVFSKNDDKHRLRVFSSVNNTFIQVFGRNWFWQIPWRHRGPYRVLPHEH